MVDTGAQISTITITMAKLLGLPIYTLKEALRIEGTGGGIVPYYGIVEVRMKIPSLPTYDDYELMLVIDDSRYGKHVPVQLGTLQIDKVLDLIDPSEMKNAEMAWRRADVVSKIAIKSATIKNEKGFSLNDVKGTLKLTKKVVIPPFSTIHVSALSKVKGHDGNINVISDAPENWTYAGAVTVPCYTTLREGSSRVVVALQNTTASAITIKPKTVVGVLSAANIVPPLIAMSQRGGNEGTAMEPETGSCEPEVNHASGAQVESSTETVPSGFTRTESKAAIPVREKTPEEIAERVKILMSKLPPFEVNDEWTVETRKQALDLIAEYESIFALEDMEMGQTDLVKHHIQLNDYTPFKERYRRIPPHQYEEVRKLLQQMLQLGAIRRSNSPWASAIVLVKKKDGTLRFCIDLRKLNARTIKDAYALPRIEESLDSLNGARWFSSVDLKSGYWQVELDEESKPLTAFTCGPLGFFECEFMPFGLTNAPATFQRLMESCLGELHLNWCIIYLDDVIIFSKTPEEHLERLRGVFERLKQAGLKLKPSKCHFFQREIQYLGHIVNANGIGTDPKKIEAIRDWPQPITVSDVRSFLGFTNYYRKFIEGYATIARPLNILVSGENAGKKKALIQWNQDCEVAFQALKKKCMETPILAYADYNKPFKLHTDASGIGLGAVLYQTDQNGHDRVIAYASRVLSKSERNYPAHKLEFLALKWAVTERFHEYLYGGEFEVFTDNNPLTYILTSAKLDATGQRWVASLANYKFEIHYKPGKNNNDADALSRINWDYGFYDHHVKEPTVNAILVAALSNRMVMPEAYLMKAARLPVTMPEIPPYKMTNERWREEQRQDPVLRKIIGLIDKGTWGTYKANDKDPEELKKFARRRAKLVMRRGLLYRKKINKKEHEPTMQFVLPKTYRLKAMEGCHDDIGHLGLRKCIDLLQDRFYWPSMAEEFEMHIKTCKNCLQFKPKQTKAPLHPITATHPLELIHLDYMTIEAPHEGAKDKNILVITDHFTRYSQAFITANQTAQCTAQTLWEKYFCYYGFPEKILTDQGANFESRLIYHLCKVASIKKLRTTPYHPQGNGQCERFNQTLINMLGTLDKRAKDKWPEMVSTLTHAYNCTKSLATGFSPFYLMYGRHPLLAVDIEFNLRDPAYTEESYIRFAKRLNHRLRWAYKKAQETAAYEAARSKKYYDRRINSALLEPGDLCIVKRKAFKGKHKIANRWENQIYKVIEKMAGSPVYRVMNTQNQTYRVLHRDMLFPILTREEGEINRIPTCDETDSDTDEYESADEEVYTGPVTRSKARKLNAKSIVAKLDKLVVPAMRSHHCKPYVKWIVERCADLINDISETVG